MEEILQVRTEQQVEYKKHLKIQNRRLFVKRYLANKSAVTGSILIALLLIITLFASWIAVQDADAVDVLSRLKPPSLEHLFGTDNFGRDLFSRVIYGTTISAQVGFAVAISASILGLIIGLYASYFKWLDQILMRIMDGLMAFPAILLAIAIVAALGPSVLNLIICLVVVMFPGIARIVRSVALVAKEQAYIEAMHSMGASRTRIIWRHIMPNTLSALIVQGSFVFAEAIIVEAALSFLGAGVPEPTPSLGNLLSGGKMFIYTSWWMTLFPGLALIFSVLGMNLLGDGLRDLLDPHARVARRKN